MPDAWSRLLEAARTSTGAGPGAPDPEGLVELLGPVVDPAVRVVAHLAQSLDGRIALPDGRSRWISGEADLTLTHRLRALCDAVVVGANTVRIDDPQLTVRRVPGPSPVRVVIDPRASVPRDRAIFADANVLRITAADTGEPDSVVLPARDGVIDPHAIVEALRARGLRRILVEGGGVTVSRFVAAGAVDRLHLVVANVLVGAGRAALTLPAPLAATLDACPRPVVRAVPLGGDVLLDCALR